ncbi:MAG: tetratricopeptide repeat protein [Desulfovibrio sp.]
MQKKEMVGAGTTRVKKDQVTYWYIRQLDQEVFESQPLNMQHVPSGLRSNIDKISFLSNYEPEPEYYRIHTVPALDSLARKVREGQEHFNLGMLEKAEQDFVKALMIDDQSVEASYGLAEVYSEQQQVEKLRDALNTLIHLDDAFKEQYKTRFNQFGMSLRKNGHLDESIKYYNKALEFSTSDDHIYFNLARVYFDKGDLQSCSSTLNSALELNPEFKEARQFLQYCAKRMAASA